MSLGPGAVDTDIWGSNATGEQRGRMMKSEQVADLALWLLTSPRNVMVEKVVLNNFSSPFVD
jgi:short-subunit dehydrogenase